MPTATPGAVRKQIKSGTTDPIYLLQGEDDVEKSALAHEFDELVEEGLRAFNVERIQAGELTTGDRLAACAAAISTAVRTLPMMSPRRVVIVLRAEGLLAPKRESETASRALEEVEAVIRHPERDTTLVFVAGSLDKRSRIYKLLAKQATLVECGVIADQGDAERWVRNRAAAAGAEIEGAGVRLLAERGWTDINRLRNDVERLLLYALGQKTIALKDVREIVGPAVLQDDWAMANAIERGNGAEALRQLAFLFDAGAVPEMILGQIGWLVRTKFPAGEPARLHAAVEALFKTDLNLKRSAGDPRALLERLVIELCTRPPSTSRPGAR